MDPHASGVDLQGDGLRERNLQQPSDPKSSQNGADTLPPGEVDPQDEKNKKTFGRTPDGTGEFPFPSYFIPSISFIISLFLVVKPPAILERGWLWTEENNKIRGK